jgi:hypothetical protein
MRKKNFVSFMIVSVISIMMLSNCGKKGPLVLEPELIPPIVTDLKISQVGSDIKLQWNFPQRFTDKKKTFLDVDKIDKIQVFYSTKEIPGEKFIDKASVLVKLKFSDLTEIDEKPVNKLAQNTSEDNSRFLSYSVSIPFKIKDLENKSIFMAIQYSIHKNKSPLSQVVFLQPMVPVKAVTGLTINRENKVVKLTWTRPQMDQNNKTVSNIAGYNIFKKIDTGEKTADENKNETLKPKPAGTSNPHISLKSKILDSFKKINKGNVLVEYFEDLETGTTGTYSYYVSSIISTQVESEPSEIVSFEFEDTYPPDVPANIACFKMTDNIFLTWKPSPDADLSHYRVYRRTTETEEYKLIADKVTEPRYTDKDVQKGKTYYYVVRSVDIKGNESKNSEEVKEQL